MAITLRTDFDVDFIDSAGSDQQICRAARVSTMADAAAATGESAGLINFLMKNRHGSPFEHNMITWRISAPIFVWREFMRHRIASYNEQSGRYMEMKPVFYIPPQNRDLVQIGKPGAYEFVPGTEEQYMETYGALGQSYEFAWEAYQFLLSRDVAKEVARFCIPLAIYSTAYVTMNVRGLMNFLSLRTKHEESTFPSYPQWEISQVANQMELDFQWKFPLTHEAFHSNGRVCP